MTKRRNKRAERLAKEERKKRLKKRRRRRALVLILELLILAGLSVAAYAIFKLEKMDHTVLDIDTSGWTQEGYTNIALFGTDSRGEGGEDGGPARSDTIIVAREKTADRPEAIQSLWPVSIMRQKK